MNIIPHKWGFVQVSFLKNREKGANSSNSPINLNQIFTSATHQAYQLYDLGLNVFPLPYGAKAGHEWKRLQYTRLQRDSAFWGLNLLTSGHCNLAVMCGSTSGNLFVIDCESVSSLTFHTNEARKRGLPLWVARTARGGHLYFRSAQGEVQNIASGVMTDTEVRGRNAYVVAPPSVHPSGARYEWILQEGDAIPTVDIQRINWLTDHNGQAIRLHAERSEATSANPIVRVLSPYSNLSKTTRYYIQAGQTLPEGTRNNRLFGAACDMAGNGYSQDEARAVLLVIAVGSGLLAYEAERTIESAYSRTRQPSRPTAQTVAVQTELWKYALVYATLHQWQGRTANNERALFLALVERARLSTNEHGVFRASVRELASLARMGVNTVQSIMTRFTADKYPMLFHCGQDNLSGANLWRFSDIVLAQGKQHVLKHDDYTLPPYWLNFTDALIHSDSVERGGLGKGAMFLYQFMKAQRLVMMPSQLAKVSLLSLNQVNYGLAKLLAFGLVKRLREGWCVNELTLAQVTEIVMTSKPFLKGKGEARRARFIKEREAFVSRILYRNRMRLEGDEFRKLMLCGVPRVLHADEVDEEIHEVLSDPISIELFSEGGTCSLENGSTISYHFFN